MSAFMLKHPGGWHTGPRALASTVALTPDSEARLPAAELQTLTSVVLVWCVLVN